MGAGAVFGGADEGGFREVGPDCATWPSFVAANPYQRPELGPQLGPTLRNLKEISASVPMLEFSWAGFMGAGGNNTLKHEHILEGFYTAVDGGARPEPAIAV